MHRAIWILLAVALISSATPNVRAESRPGPTPSATPNVWVDQNSTRQCELNFPCVPSVAQAVNLVDAGGSVFVYALPWTYNETVSIDKPMNVTGQNRSVVVDGKGAPIVFRVTSRDVRIENLTITDAGIGIQVIAGQGTVVQNVAIQAVSRGVELQGGNGTVFRDSEVRASGGPGFVAFDARNTTIDNVTSVGGAAGIVAQGVQGLTVSRSQLAQAGGWGMLVARATILVVGDGNNVSSNVGGGISVDGSREVTIRGNRFEDNGLSGLNVTGSVNVRVQGNLFRNNGRLAIPPRGPGPAPSPLQGGGGGVRFLQTDPVFVAGNLVVNNSFFGIGIGGVASTDYSVTGNNVSGTGGPGLLITDGASRIDVAGDFIGNQGAGIEFDNATAVTIHDALIQGNQDWGIRGQWSTNVSVRRATLINNTAGGSRFLQTDPSEIRDSVIASNGGSGVELGDTTDFTLANNTVTDGLVNFYLVDTHNTTLVGNRLTGALADVRQVGGDVTSSRNSIGSASEGFDVSGSAFLSTTNDTFNATAFDFWIQGGSRVIALNDSRAAGQAVLDPVSNFTAEWFLDVLVLDAGGNPAPGAVVRIFDLAGSEAFNGTADPAGTISWIVLNEYDQQGSNVYDHTPHNATAYLTGPDEGSVSVFMNRSKSVTIRLVQDLGAPTITNLTAVPDPQEQFQSVDVSADVVDAHLASVFLNVTYPDSSSVNATMSPTGGNRFHLIRTYGLVGAYAYSVIARDTFGNVAIAGGSFRIFPPNAAPSITNVAATPDPSEAGSTVNVTATIQDGDGIDTATVAITFPDASVFSASLTPAGSTWYFEAPYSAPGPYSFTITAKDANTSFPRTSTATGSFTVRDTTSPVANAGPDQTVPQNTLVQFDGTGSSDVVGIVNYTWTLTDGTPRTLYGPTPSYFFSNVGGYAVVLTVRDAAGNAGADAMTVTVQDITPPVISGAAANPATVEAPGNTTITFTATDNDAIVGAWVEGWSPANASIGNVSVFVAPNTFNPATWSLNALGPYLFLVSVVDASGNWVVRPVVVLAEDSTAPTFLGAGAQPATQQVLSPVVLWAQVADPYLDAALIGASVLSPGGPPFGTFALTYNSSSARYEVAVTPSALGTYSFTIWALDTSGNNATRPGTFVSRDTQAPIIASIAITPQPQDVFGTVDVSAAVSENFALATVTIDLVNPSGTPVGTATMLLGGDTRWHDTRAYAVKGFWSYTVHAVDTSGNPAAPFSGTISIVDREAPAVTNLTKSPSSTERGRQVRVNATVTDNVGVDLVTLEVTDPAGNPSGNFTMACDAAGHCTFTRTYDLAGDYALRVWGRDTSGNLASATGTLRIVEGAAPVADGGPDVAIDVGQSVSFDGSRSTDDYGIVSYTWRFTYDGRPVALSGVTPAAFHFNVSGTYTVTLTVEDAAGHQKSDTMTVSVRGAGGGVSFDPLLLVPLALIIFLVLVFVVRWMRRRAAGREASAEAPAEATEEARAAEERPAGVETEEPEPSTHEEEEL